MDHATSPDALDELLTRWRSHDDLRRNGATVTELAVSRWQLDAARAAVR